MNYTVKLSNASLALVFSVVLLAGCSSMQETTPVAEGEQVSFVKTGVDPARDFEEPEPEEEKRVGQTLFEQRGTGDFFSSQAVEAPVASNQDSVNVSFENAPLADVLQVMLGDLLKVPYSIEAGVEGNITLVSTSPVPRTVLMDMLEAALAERGLAIVRSDGGVFRVGTIEALRGEVPLKGPGQAQAAGYGMRIVPLKYLAAAEAQNILESLGMGDRVLRVDPLRNVLMVGASGPQMQNILRTLEMMDVDILEGMSLGVYEVVNLEAGVLVERLTEVFTNPELEQFSMTAKMVALEEVNSVMVVAPNPETLDTISNWLGRLDTIGLDDSQAGSQLYVYDVQNGEAVELAGLLGEIFGGSAGNAGTQARTSGAVAPGMAESDLGNQEGNDSSGARGGAPSAPKGTTTDSGTRIVADEVNNSILIMASPKEWQTVRSALQKLDKTPSQVLVEVSIWEVTLNDELRFGVDWFFNTQTGSDGVRGGGLLSLQDGGGVGRLAPGFSYLFTGSDWRAVINALDSKSDVKSLSSPSILVLDNREATIQVGRQQPFSSSQTVNTNNSDGLITQNIELKDTGVMLRVKPRVNSGGLVVMEIEQEVTDVGELDQATGQRAFLKRNIESTVAIQSGDTIILGGLIENQDTNSDAGVPFLKSVPFVGSLFGTSSTDSTRTELLVTISPRAVGNYQDFDLIGDEFRKKMQGVAEAFREEFKKNNSTGAALPVE